jgi:hypothetical protein
MKSKNKKKLRQLTEKGLSIAKKKIESQREMGEMLEYNPSNEPDPGWWLSLSEFERLTLVMEYHDKTSEEYGQGESGRKLHATFHCIIENQIAEGVEETQRLVIKKSQEFGNRHEAIHYLARDISGDIFLTMQQMKT